MFHLENKAKILSGVWKRIACEVCVHIGHTPQAVKDSLHEKGWAREQGAFIEFVGTGHSPASFPVYEAIITAPDGRVGRDDAVLEREYAEERAQYIRAHYGFALQNYN